MASRIWKNNKKEFVHIEMILNNKTKKYQKMVTKIVMEHQKENFLFMYLNLFLNLIQILFIKKV